MLSRLAILATLLALALAAPVALNGEVHELGEAEQPAAASNATQAAGVAQEDTDDTSKSPPAELKEPKPKTVHEAELGVYIEKVRKVLKTKDDRPASEEHLKDTAERLMTLEKASATSSREKEIERSLRSDGPAAARVEVDPERQKQVRAEKAKQAAVKAAEEKRIADEKKFQAAAEKKETRRADELLKQYQKEYHEPGLASAIHAARQAYHKAAAHAEHIKPSLDVDGDEYGIHGKGGKTPADGSNQ